MSGTLDLANFSTVWADDFSKDSGFNGAIWDHEWGPSDDFHFGSGALTITSYKSEGWQNAGFIQPNRGASNSQGYGLYSVTASAPAGQGVGIAVLLWPSTDVWPGPELDMIENWSDPSNQTVYATIHWKGANNSNQFSTHQMAVDLTKPHTYAMDWEAGRITYYIDGNEMWTTTSNVPADAAHGGENEAFGAEVTAAGSGAQPGDHVSLNLYSMSYAKFTGGGTGSGSGGGTTGGGTTGGGTGSGSGGGTVDPRVVIIPAGAGAFSSVDSGKIFWTGDAGKPVFLAGAASLAVMDGSGQGLTGSGNSNDYWFTHGNATLADHGAANLITAAAGSSLTVTTDVLDNWDRFSLGAVLATLGWDGKAADAGQYFSVASQGADAMVTAHAAGGSAAVMALDLKGAAGLDLAGFLAHSVLT